MQPISNRRLQAAKRAGKFQHRGWRLVRIQSKPKTELWQARRRIDYLAPRRLDVLITLIDSLEDGGKESVLENEQSGG